MKSQRYLKIVEWSFESQCFIGQCPGIIGPCCHGENMPSKQLKASSYGKKKSLMRSRQGKFVVGLLDMTAMEIEMSEKYPTGAI